MPTIFINFRGRDQAGYAALLDRELSEAFGRDAVFLSSRSIRPGDDYVAEILANLRMCDVLLSVIGPGWLGGGDLGTRSGQIDWVLREIAEALGGGIRVVPILVEDAALPDETDLPADITALVRCQYLRLHHRTVDQDLARITEEVGRNVPSAVATGHAGDTRSGPVPMFELAPSGRSQCHIGVVPGSIRHVRFADIWINSENTDMEMSRPNEFTISAVIRYLGARHAAGGAIVDDAISNALARAVGPRRPVAPGTAFVTTAGALAETHNVRHIVHVASVQGEPGAGFRPIRDVGSCVSAALIAADRLATADRRVRSAIFPLLGAGVAGAGARVTATAMINAIMDFLADRPGTALRAIYLLGHTKLEYRTTRYLLDTAAALIPATTSG